MIDRLSLSVELATKHLGRDWHLEHITGELAMSVGVVNVGRTFENLRGKSAIKNKIKQKRNARILDTPL